MLISEGLTDQSVYDVRTEEDPYEHKIEESYAQDIERFADRSGQYFFIVFICTLLVR
jgi:hypothetical protein